MLPKISSSRNYRVPEKLLAADDGRSDSAQCDDIFGAMVRRQVRLRKQIASSRQSRSVAGHEHSAPSADHGRSSLTSLRKASTNGSEDANATLDMRARHSSKKQNRTSEDIDPEALFVSPWDMLVKEHRQRIQAYEDVPQVPTQDDLLETEDVQDEPDPPSRRAPSKKKHQPAPPPASAGWLGIAARQKQKEAMEQEQNRQREQQERESEGEACWREQSRKEEQQRARRRRQSDRASQSVTAEDCEGEGSPMSEKPSWAPWRLPSLLKRQPSKTYQQCPPSSKGRYWVGRWPWRNSKVAQECEQGSFDQELKPPAIEAKAAQENTILRADNLMESIDEELDRTRHQSLQERRKTFRDLQRQLHPDKNMADPDSAKLAFQYLMDNRRNYLS